MRIAPGYLYRAAFAHFGSARFNSGVEKGGGGLAYSSARYFVIYAVGGDEQAGFIALFLRALACSLIKGEYISRHPDVIIKRRGGNSDIGASARFYSGIAFAGTGGKFAQADVIMLNIGQFDFRLNDFGLKLVINLRGLM